MVLAKSSKSSKLVERSASKNRYNLEICLLKDAKFQVEPLLPYLHFSHNRKQQHYHCFVFQNLSKHSEYCLCFRRLQNTTSNRGYFYEIRKLCGFQSTFLVVARNYYSYSIFWIIPELELWPSRLEVSKIGIFNSRLTLTATSFSPTGFQCSHQHLS